jgi:hypothetical protein
VGEQILTSSKVVIIGNLTPGTLYTFQVRRSGRLGYTDRSDPVNRNGQLGKVYISGAASRVRRRCAGGRGGPFANRLVEICRP